MDLSYPASAEEFRTRVRDFIAANVPADFAGIGSLEFAAQEELRRDWRRVLAENSLLAVSWPSQYGGAGLTSIEQVVLAEEFTKAGVPMGTESDMFGIQLLGNTLVVR